MKDPIWPRAGYGFCNSNKQNRLGLGRMCMISGHHASWCFVGDREAHRYYNGGTLSGADGRKLFVFNTRKSRGAVIASRPRSGKAAPHGDLR